jgi:periplasmic divalent cation tolerance protein
MFPDQVLVMITLPGDTDAPAFARALVEARVAACVSILPPVESVYRWEGAIEHATERQLLIKTTRDRTEALWGRVRELHPYEVPEFLVLPVIDGHDAYLRWITESTRPVLTEPGEPKGPSD